MGGKNIGNPYMKNPSGFGSKDDYDWLRYTPHTSVKKENYNPEDKTNSGKLTPYEKRAIPVYEDFKGTAKKFLESGTEKAKEKLQKWYEVDLRDKQAVNDFVINLLKEVDEQYAFDNMGCHNFAGILSALLDKRHIDYDCCMGKIQTPEGIIDHTWIRIGDDTYEKFRNNKQYNIEVEHKVITTYLKKKEGK